MHNTTYKYNIGERIFDEKRDLIILHDFTTFINDTLAVELAVLRHS